MAAFFLPTNPSQKIQGLPKTDRYSGNIIIYARTNVDTPILLVDSLGRDMSHHHDRIKFEPSWTPGDQQYTAHMITYAVWAVHDSFVLREAGQFNLSVAVHHARRHLRDLVRGRRGTRSKRVADCVEKISDGHLLSLRLKVDGFPFELPRQAVECFRPPFEMLEEGG